VPRIEPLRREDLPQHEETFTAVENALGVLPNSTLTMARWPELMTAFAHLNAVVMAEGRVSGVLKQMVAAMANFGFLNRWNDTMATELERPPFTWARENLADAGWDQGPCTPRDLQAPAP
jgi:hypothetical protein